MQHVTSEMNESVEFLQISMYQELLKLLHFWPSYSRNNDNFYFTAYGNITTIQYNMQYKTIEHNKQCELN